jgi:hypothetical protein
MGNNATGAIVEVDGDISGLKKAMEEGTKAVQSFEVGAKHALDGVKGMFGQFDDALGAVKTQMNEFSFIMNAIGLAGLGAGLTMAFREMKGLAKEWMDLGDEAKERGINAEFYQSLQIQARQFSVEQKDVSEGLKAFKDAMGEIDTDGSNASEAVGKFSKSLLEQLKGETDVEKQLRLVANALKASTDETERGTVAAALFGKEHAQVAEILLGGEKGLDAWMTKAKGSGQIVDNESVDAAKRLKFALDAIADSPGIRAIEGILIRLTVLAAKALGSDAVLTTEELQKKLDDTIAALEKARGMKEPDFAFSGYAENRQKLLADMENRIEALRALLASRLGQEDRKKAASDYEAPDSSESKKTDTTAADKWVEAMNIKALRDNGDFYAAIELQRQQDLMQFDKYVEKLGDAWTKQAEARLAIEAKYAAEMRKQFEKEYVQPVSSAISSDLERAFSSWMSKGKMDWRELANSIIQDLAKIALRMAVLQPLFGGGSTGGTGLFGSMLSGMMGTATASANGNIFDGGNLAAFASGGIVETPSIFGMRDGQTGLMGEAGPEAIMPLARGSDGRLGVQAAGGAAAPTVHFHVQATDVGSFQKSEGQMTAMLSRMVSRASRYS